MVWKDGAIYALKDSIRHWEAMQDDPECCDEEPNAIDCACCRAFHVGAPDGCTQCPIRLRTGYHNCTGSPYEAASDEITECDPGPATDDMIQFLKDTLKQVEEGKVKP